MKPTDLTDALFEQEMEKFLSTVQFWATRLRLIDIDFQLRPSPTEAIEGHGPGPFPMAADIKLCWDYARGTGPKPYALRQILRVMLEFCWAPIFGTSYSIPESWWSTPLGYMTQVCWARAKLDNGSPLTTQELAYLTGVSERKIRQLCKEGSLAAEPRQRNGRRLEWVVEPAAARQFVAEQQAAEVAAG
ncbi:MAG: hypothetical protein QHH05_07025 [Syntrophomonadaceae bacterium]|jgi:hypothetical protein|nr:hypothetical protein [Syntrophomonadaceae bacterium]